jgi:glutaredoxin 3
MAKEYLSSHGVEFDAKDVTVNPANLQELMEVTGGMRGVPVIVIGGEVVRGFNKEKVAALLSLRA